MGGDIMAKQVNGINVDNLTGFTNAVTKTPDKGRVDFSVTSRWKGQTRMEAEVSSFTMGGVEIPKSFTIATDEPEELLGANTAPNPQELLMAAVNACMMVGFVANAAARGIVLEKLEIETHGQLDLRGFLGISEDVIADYDSMSYTVTVKGNATPE